MTFKQATITLLITLIGFLTLGVAGSYETAYTRQATIRQSSGGIVQCIDKQGHLWEYEGEGVVGQQVTLIMNDNHTSTIADDTVKGVKQ